MRSFNTVISLIAVLFRAVIACDVDMPGIMLSVQFEDPDGLVSPQSTEFVIPLYANCDDYVTPAQPIQAGGSKPVVVISASFPGDAFGFSSPVTQELLDQTSLNAFLEAKSTSIGMTLDVDSAMPLYLCTLTGTDRKSHSFDFSSTVVFPEGLPIEVESYQCEFATLA